MKKKEWTPDKSFSNLNWEKFCQLYARDTEFFGNGVQSYIESYPREKGQRQITYQSARTRASNLLTNVNILERINYLLDLHLNDQIVDKNLGIVVLQNADFRAKVQAIKEYNQLKKRIKREIDLVLPQPILNVIQADDSDNQNPESQEKN